MTISNLAMILIPESRNAKTGNIIQSYSHRSTCPNRCPLKGNGCYADNYHTSHQWNRCEDKNDFRYIANYKDLMLDLMSAAAAHAKRGRKEVLFRHNVAGDVAYENSNIIDSSRVRSIADACKLVSDILNVKLRGYTYTHCEISSQNTTVIHEALERGFVINYSCETVREAKMANNLGCDAVITAVNPEETIKELKKVGLRSVQCPAQTHDNVSCERCRLCSRHRDTVIVFKIHGNGSNKARKVIMLKNSR